MSDPLSIAFVPSDKIYGTSLQGYFKARYWDIVDVFGPPNVLGPNAKNQDNNLSYNKVSGLQKEYVCVVKGLLKGDNVTCFSSIEKDALGFSKISFSDLHNTSNNNIVKNGLSFASKESIALLTYSHVAYNDSLDVTLVRVLLISGRKHQIRLQMSQMGHEIFGDEKYGFDKRRCQHIDFIALHSHRLTLQHPVKKDIVRFRLNIILK
jgi:23S rRNA-/tRNA-specific pseudouridylate synthase